MVKTILSFCCLSLLFACGQEEEVPPLQLAADYFGLADGDRKCFSRSDGADEAWTVTKYTETDTVWQYQVQAENNGFVVQDRTLSLDVTEEGLFLSSWMDCKNACMTPNSPLKMLSNPVYDRDRFEVEATIEQLSGVLTEEVTETHVFFASEEKPINTLEGLKDGHDIQWTRTQGDDVWSHTLVFVGDEGFIGWTDSNGIKLAQVECSE
ncbi:MAG: hypothetical protein CMH56_04655 [Myxococcales bacterium]|nr:hypothetical protein [Myxococcales bacterium]